jgi:hypothetical protein
MGLRSAVVVIGDFVLLTTGGFGFGGSFFSMTFGFFFISGCTTFIGAGLLCDGSESRDENKQKFFYPSRMRKIGLFLLNAFLWPA